MHMHCVEKALEVFSYILTVVMDSTGDHGLSHLTYKKSVKQKSLSFWWIGNMGSRKSLKDSVTRYRQIIKYLDMLKVGDLLQCWIIFDRWSFLTIEHIEGATKPGEGEDPLPVLGVEWAEDLCFAVGDVVSLGE